MRRVIVVLTFLLTLPAAAVTVDRIAAIIDRQVVTVSEINQMVDLRFFPRTAQTDDEHRRNVLDALIAQALRFRDVERFGAQEITADAIEARRVEIQRRFASEAEFQTAIAKSELTPDEILALIKRQLQVEAYIQERFAPLVFVSAEEIEEYYRGPWSTQRRDRGLAIPPLAQVQTEVRTLLRTQRLDDEIARWTAQLRARADVDVYAWR